MKTTIDRAGRVVIPKAVRDEARLEAGSELEIVFRDGRIEIEPATVPMRLHAGAIEPDATLPPLSPEVVRETLEQTRR